jgi:hypothetical protein
MAGDKEECEGEMNDGGCGENYFADKIKFNSDCSRCADDCSGVREPEPTVSGEPNPPK